MDSCLDLGVIDGPCLVFGGPYSNLQATEALFEAAHGHGIPASRMICTGDVVAYCGNPEKTVKLVRTNGIHVIMGNCEESLGFDASDCGCGFVKDSACDVLSQQWYRYASAYLSNNTKRWMRDLPRMISFGMAQRRLTVIHGGISAINRFIFPATEVKIKQAELKLAKTDGVIAGHSGVPFTEIIAGQLWHNAGVVGMPANDGTARVWYSILTPESNHISIEHIPLNYNVAGAVKSMHKYKLPQGYSTALESGVWPSDDVMPPIDRARRGSKIELKPVKWG